MENIYNYTQEVILPSRGYLNPEIPEGKVVQRCMMVSDQKFIAGSRGGHTTQNFVERTIVSPETFDYSNLTTADSLFLLFKLRILSYGENYKFITRCPECGKKIEVSIDLSKLGVNYLDEDYEKKLSVTLPRSGDTVYTKILRNRDLEEIEAEIERRKKKQGEEIGNSSSYTLRLASMIKRIELKTPTKDGDKVLTHPIDIQNYLDRLTDLDAIAIRSTVDNVKYGIVPTVEYVCPKCNEDIDVNIQFTPQFFRPRYDA